MNKKNIFTNITDDEKRILVENYENDVINKLENINYIVDDWLNDDDTIYIVLHKIIYIV